MSIVAADVITVLLARIRQNVYYTVDGVWRMCVVNKSELKVIMTNRYDDEASSDVST